MFEKVSCLSEKYYQNSRASLDAIGMNGLKGSVGRSFVVIAVRKSLLIVRYLLGTGI